MFKVYDVGRKKEVTVYQVSSDNRGLPVFLIYENNKWIWGNASHFEPVCD